MLYLNNDPNAYSLTPCKNNIELELGPLRLAIKEKTYLSFYLVLQLLQDGRWRGDCFPRKH